MLPAVALLCLAQAAASPSAARTPSPRPTPSGPVVVLETSAGRIRIGLYEDKAPLSTENFLRYVRKGHYDGTVFHRVMPNFMIQGGGMTPDLAEKPTDPPIRNEARNGVRNSRGTVAMARTNDPNSATSQFFINLKDNPFLDFGIRGAGYAVFGEVMEGMDVVDKIATVPTTSVGPNSDVPVKPVMITSARVEGGSRAGTARPASPRPAASAGVGAAKPRPRPSGSPRPTTSPRPAASPRT